MNSPDVEMNGPVGDPLSLSEMVEIWHGETSSKVMVDAHDVSIGTFITPPPQWRLSNATITLPSGHPALVVQQPFEWVDGAWQANVSVCPIEPPEGLATITLTVRITPDTMRRWRDVEINPFVEATAQLRDHLRSARGSAGGTLTFL